MDGTFLVGDHTEASTTSFLEREFAFAGLRWIRLDIDRIVTIGRSDLIDLVADIGFEGERGKASRCSQIVDR